MRRVIVLLTAVLMLLVSLSVPAEEACVDGRCATEYPAGFFARYTPSTALDMVRNLPGYVLDDGDRGQRGFGATAGNLLIDGARVSSKSESPSDILRRIPAAEVERIVLLRGQLGGLDLANQSLVANVMRRPRGTSGTWRVRANQYRPDARVFKGLDLNLAGHALGLRYNAGLALGDYLSLLEADEKVLDATGRVIERRDEVFAEDGDFYVGSFTLDGQLGKNEVSFNARLNHFDEAGGERSRRRPVGDAGFDLLQGDIDGGDDWEIGFDLERSLAAEWSAKFIGLTRRDNFEERGSVSRREPPNPTVDQVVTEFRSRARESIARVELDFSGIEGHLLEWSLEATDNVLDSRFGLFVNAGQGFAPVEVPGAATQVSERRYDVSVTDAFRIGAVALDVGLGVERSKIDQRGGFSESRSFVYWKPSVLAAYAMGEGRQLRLGVRRSVGQLDFFDFVSSADLGDAELSLGNPSLQPERTTRVEAVYERRFAELGSLSLTLFHDWVKDVEDLLPLEDVLEVPGNIGDGRRGGLALELTLPLDSVGLRNGRVDARGRWQDSQVDDPLSGRPRVLSGERDWEGSITVRQDHPGTGFTWSLKAFAVDNAPAFGLDEVDLRGERFDIDAFVEMRLSSRLRLQLGVENLLRDGDARDRRVFVGPRTDGLLAFREVRERSFAREIFLNLKGTF
ncbi:MAG: TonB-dependent receptor [Pseudomonadota bacterium]